MRFEHHFPRGPVKRIKMSMVTSLLNSENCNTVDWTTIKQLLHSNHGYIEEGSSTSLKDDPRGRIFIVDVIAKDPPKDIIEDILCLYPDSLTANISAFFAACRCESLDVIRLLIKYVLRKGSTKVDSCPYPWIVVSHVTAQAANVLLEEYPQGVLQPKAGVSSDLCPLDSMIFSTCDMRSQSPDHQWWGKLKLMLMVSEHGTVNTLSGHVFHPVHTLLKRVLNNSSYLANSKTMQHILSLLHHIQGVEPFQFRMKDDNGDYPLHIVLRGRVQDAPCSEAATDLIFLILGSYPSSARSSTREGRLPLHLALENGWPCHEALLKAAPEALQTRDSQTLMYPFQTAACSNVARGKRNRPRKRRRSNIILDVTYKLLREDPLQARGLLDVHG